jgi:ribose transport system ATP-binding protein
MESPVPASGPGPAAGTSVSITGLSKSFNGVPALIDVNLEIRRGEIHGLLGQNGSGKSTLIKALAGFHDPDSGALSVDGRDIPLPLGAGTPQELGFAFVHQDLGLIPSLSVLENLRLPYFATATIPKLGWRQMHRDAAQVLATYGVELDTHAQVSDLAPVEQSMLAIIRAVDSIAGVGGNRAGSLLVLDEPTVYLPQREVEMLFRLVRQVAESGTGVLFVSHDLDEVLEICDRVTVLRDGRLIDTVESSSLTKSAMVRLIVGHDPAGKQPRPAAVPAEREARVAARIEQASGATVHDVSFTVHAGEIVGATGLAGSGFAELPYLLYGATEDTSGTISVGGRSFDLARLRPRSAVSEGIILVPGNRQVDGCVQTLTVTENVTLPLLSRFVRKLVLRHGGEKSYVHTLLGRFGVVPKDPDLSVGSLSGGNQQKVLLAKWLQIAPRLLLFDEPTQGVDVGAREQIFAILRDETARGAGIVCASSDHEQLAAICDRVLVLSRGRIVHELMGDQLTKQEITRRCLTTSAA